MDRPVARISTTRTFQIALALPKPNKKVSPTTVTMMTVTARTIMPDSETDDRSEVAIKFTPESARSES